MNNPRSELADLIVEIRGTKNQQEFQSELETLVGLKRGEMGAKYVSLVETGVRKKLSEEFLAALEKKTGRPKAELAGMHQRVSDRVARRQIQTARIVSGHTAFASGLIGAALKGISQVEISTCASRPNGAPLSWQPSRENARWITFREGAIPAMKDEKFLAQIADEKNTYYFSANDAIDALDAGWADVAAIPAALVEGRRNYVRLLRLVASDAACALICFGKLAEALLPHATKRDLENPSAVKKGWEKGKDIPVFDLTTRDLGRAIKECRSDGVKIGAEVRTIAEVVLDEALGFATTGQSDEPELADLLVPIASHNAATFDAKDMDPMRVKTKKGMDQKMEGLLIWDPHASWVAEKLKANGAVPHALISISRSPNPKNHRPRRFEFDLVTTAAKSADADLLRAARDWMFRIWDTSEELSLIKPTIHHGLVNALTSYFELGGDDDSTTMKRAARVLGSISYDVALKMEAFALFDSISK